MQRNGASAALLRALDEIIIHGVDTKSFFAWPQQWNGLLWVNTGAP